MLTIKGAINRIRESGDLLERHIFSDEAFANEFGAYAQVWAEYVLPARTKGTLRVDGAWKDFAEVHYSALVRSRIAYDMMCRLARSSQEPNQDSTFAAVLMDVHASFQEFFAAIGSVEDLRKELYETIPLAKPNGTRLSAPENSELRTLYARRNLFVHERLVPVFEYVGTLAIDQKILGADESQVQWGNSPDIEDLSVVVERLWKEFCTACHSVWSDLITTVHRHGIKPIQLQSPSQGANQLVNLPVSPSPSGAVQLHTIKSPRGSSPPNSTSTGF